jgi:DNA-binding CsgD family transcriptional regulator
LTTTRNAEICALYAAGHTLREIAARHGLSAERVRQILRDVGGPTAADTRAARAAKREREDAHLRSRVDDDVRDHPGSTVDEIAARLGLDVRTVNGALTPAARRLVVRRGTRSTTTWSDEDLLQVLRLAASYAFPLTVSEYGSLIACGEVCGPTALTIEKRFGSWIRACRVAGVEPGRQFRTSYQSTWTDDDLVGYVTEYLGDERYAGTFEGYDVWRVRERPDAPSAPTIRNRLGQWAAVKQRLLREPRAPLPDGSR